MGPPLGIRDVCGRGRVEFALEVPVAEPVDGEVAGQHRGEQVGGVRVDRVEGGNVASVAVPGRHSASSSGVACARKGHAGQRLQETTVGGMGHLGVAPEIGDALGHWTPPRLLTIPSRLPASGGP